MQRDSFVNPLQRIKDALQEWASWAIDREKGYPSQSAFATERVQNANRSTETFYDRMPPHVTKLDQAINQMPKKFVAIICMQYKDKRPQKVKAAVLQMSREVFSQRVLWIHEQLDFSMYGDELL